MSTEKRYSFATTRPVAILMVFVAAVVFGLVALGRLDMRLLPEIRYATLTVQTEAGQTVVTAGSFILKNEILKDAVGLQKAGAQMLVLECVPALLAAEITRALDIPVIGIGAGVDVDGQVLVLHDMLGITMHGTPSFVRDFLAEEGTVAAALSAYVHAVRAETFPAEEHTFK